MTNRTSKKVPSAPPKEGVRRGPIPKLWTIEETAELFETSPRTVRRLICSGALPIYRIGRLVRISDADIAAFLVANREG
jgi:excisionase family DNA binding protein